PIAAADGDLARKYVVYRFANSTEATTHINDGTKIYAVSYANKAALPASAGGYFLVTALDKNNNESEAGAGIILPVTGFNLNVRLAGNTTLINWTTRTEINTKQFEIERSTDGNTFSYLTTVGAAGNSTDEKRYSAQDFLSTPGTYYYRVKTVDRDGRSTYSMVKSVVYSKTGSGIIVGPNPFVQTINISNLQGVKRLELVDLAGRVVLTKRLTNQSTTTLPTAELPAGVYHLRVTNNKDGFEIIKVVKM
ncbi:MAG TPA: T9SS type A sorting domain-containing protein, partial [Flavisolibacter sp.]